jgi:hypothetical protein
MKREEIRVSLKQYYIIVYEKYKAQINIVHTFILRYYKTINTMSI